MTATPTPAPNGGFLPNGHEWDISRTGLPLLDNTIDALVVAALLIAAGLTIWAKLILPQIKSLKASLAAVAEDTAETRKQTSNDHQSAPYPNLRENIDANQREMRAGIAKALERMDALAEAITRLDAKQEIILQEAKELRQDLWETKARVTALESRSPPTEPTSSIKPPS